VSYTAKVELKSGQVQDPGPGFLRMYVRYMTWRAAALEAPKKGGGRPGRSRTRVLVIRTDWNGIGTGHIGPTVAEWLMFAMVSNRVLFIDERAAWNYQEYFQGMAYHILLATSRDAT